MAEIWLRVTYRVRAHQMAEFEELLQRQVMPLAREMGLEMNGFYRTLIGDVGEYMELWPFSSLGEFEGKWRRFICHPELKEIFQKSGPMVENERFTILEKVPDPGLS